MSAEDKVAFGDEKQGHDVEAVAQVISAGNEEDDIVEFDEKKDLKCVSSAKGATPTLTMSAGGVYTSGTSR